MAIVTLKLKAEYTSGNLQWSKNCTFYAAFMKDASLLSHDSYTEIGIVLECY